MKNLHYLIKILLQWLSLQKYPGKYLHSPQIGVEEMESVGFRSSKNSGHKSVGVSVSKWHRSGDKTDATTVK